MRHQTAAFTCIQCADTNNHTIYTILTSFLQQLHSSLVQKQQEKEQTDNVLEKGNEDQEKKLDTEETWENADEVDREDELEKQMNFINLLVR